jgi:hypothetical protein
MKNNPHIQTLIVMVILFGLISTMYFMPVVGIFTMLFFLVYAVVYSEIINQQDGDAKQ